MDQINEIGDKFIDSVNNFKLMDWPFSVKEIVGQDVEFNIINFFNNDIKSYGDIKTRGWAVMRIEDAIVFTAAYLLIIFIGYIFRNRNPKPQPRGVTIWGYLRMVLSPKPEDLIGRGTALFNLVVALLMLAYNATQVALCAFMVYSAVREALEQNYSIVCNGFSLKETGMARIVHVFYLSKILDFMDTFFMVIRGKWRQVSFLHLYHHTSIFWVYWLDMNAGYDGDIYFTVVLNGFIHFIMYFYYGCTALGISVPSFIKMFITNSQLTQFVAMMIQGVTSLTLGCSYPKNIVIMYLLYLCTMFYLFMDFHRKTYGKKNKKAVKPKSS